MINIAKLLSRNRPISLHLSQHVVEFIEALWKVLPFIRKKSCFKFFEFKKEKNAIYWLFHLVVFLYVNMLIFFKNQSFLLSEMYLKYISQGCHFLTLFIITLKYLLQFVLYQSLFHCFILFLHIHFTFLMDFILALRTFPFARL